MRQSRGKTLSSSFSSSAANSAFSSSAVFARGFRGWFAIGGVMAAAALPGPTVDISVPCIRLRGPMCDTEVMIPVSTWKGEYRRLQEEAARDDSVQLGQAEVNRVCRQRIKNLYARVCFKCKEEITLHYKDEPLCRQLDPADVPADAYSQWDWFCASCWPEYQRQKNNKRRRQRYRGPIAAAMAIADEAVAPAAIADVAVAAPALPIVNHGGAPEPAVDPFTEGNF